MTSPVRINKFNRCSFINAVMKDVPQEDHKEAIREVVMNDAVSQLPTKIQAIWMNVETRYYLNMEWTNEGGVSISVPCASRDEKCFALTEQAQLHVDRLEMMWDAQEARMGELKSKLGGIVSSVRTFNQLAEMLPEFTKYMPIGTGADRSVPVLANVITAFMQAGWPKGGATA